MQKIRNVIEKLDPELEKHFRAEEVDFFQFAFRMVICLLVREFPMHLSIRLMDTYIADHEGLNVLHIYVCAALILKFSSRL